MRRNDMKCSECNHWKRLVYSWGETKFGHCDSPRIVHCSDGRGPVPFDGLGYSAFEGGVALVEMGEDFGCIHFRVKPILIANA
jgi:hypothetical protein